MRIFILCLFISLAVGVLARAEVPLVLEATITLPASGPWDVQHWMDDSTFGWASVTGRTISYLVTSGDSIRHYTVPGYGLIRWVRILRLTSNPAHAYAVVHSTQTSDNGDGGWWAEWHVCLIDLSNGQPIGSFEQTGGYYNCTAPNAWSRDSRAVRTFLVWPSPPEASSVLLSSITSDYQYENDIPGYGCSEHRIAGTVFGTALQPDTLTPVAIAGGGNMSLFNRPDRIRLAFWGRQYCTGGCSSGPCGYDSCLANHFDSVTGNGANYGLLGCVDAAVAQQNADSTGRIVLRRQRSVQALDGETHTLLWQDSTISGALYTALLAGGHDERLLAYDSLSGRFHIYDAANGAYLDDTTPISGSPQYLIKSPGHPSQIVTSESDGNVRVYSSAVPYPSRLTCLFFPEGGTLQLSWQEVPGAVQYRVYSSSNASSLETLEAVLPAGTHYLSLVPQDNRRFYSITSDYGTR